METPHNHDVGQPIQAFSDCHVGIVGTLRDLGKLPSLLDPVRRARDIAGRVQKHFHEVVITHHREEESELFAAVQASAAAGEERATVDRLIARLTAEHRHVEAEFAQLEPALRAIEKGADADLDAAAVQTLVARYLDHARFEEEVFLPLAQRILGRSSDHMAALGLSLHIRHASEELLRRYGHI